MADEHKLIDPLGAVAKAAGLPIPDDRIAGVNGLAADLVLMAAQLRGMGLVPADEPSNIYNAEAAK